MQINKKPLAVLLLPQTASKQAQLNVVYTEEFWLLWNQFKHLELGLTEKFPSDMLFSRRTGALTKGNIFYQVFVSCGNLTFYW